MTRTKRHNLTKHRKNVHEVLADMARIYNMSEEQVVSACVQFALMQRRKQFQQYISFKEATTQ